MSWEAIVSTLERPLPRSPDPCRPEVRVTHGLAIVELRGVVDLACREALCAAVWSCAAERPAAVAVDLAGVVHIDEAGLQTLRELRRIRCIDAFLHVPPELRAVLAPGSRAGARVPGARTGGPVD